MKITILAIKISRLSSYKETYNTVLNKVSSASSPAYITVNNVHTVVEGVKNKEYGKIINSAFLALPDGKPLSVVAKIKGAKNIARIFGPTFMEKTIDWGRKDGLKHFFWGSTKETLEKMMAQIKAKYSEVNIVGAVSPPFRALTEKENMDYIRQMNDADPDIVWIALGAPKQEIWMYENYKKLNRGVMIGIGAGFDYLAGNTKHAPSWMKRYALEWLYRLIQEPGRLWKRYLVTNTLFIWYLLLELLHLKKFD